MGINVLKHAMKVDVQIVKWLYNSIVDVEQYIEKYNVGKQNKQNNNSIAILSVRKSVTAAFISVTHNVVNLKD